MKLLNLLITGQSTMITRNFKAKPFWIKIYYKIYKLQERLHSDAKANIDAISIEVIM